MLLEHKDEEWNCWTRLKMCSTDDESGDDQSTMTQNDVDSEVSFEDDADEEIDSTVFEEEDSIDYIKRSARKMQWKKWHTQRSDAGTGPTKDEMEIGTENSNFTE